jgi:hypothetical protein
MKTQVTALKVKIKSLAAEARIIRLEEDKALCRKRGAAAYTPSGAPGGDKKPKQKSSPHRKEDRYQSLREHRVFDVRKEQRASLLAYAFIRGKSYAAVEKPHKDNPPDLDRVQKLVEKFGGPPYRPCKCPRETVVAWRAGTLVEHPFAVKADATKSQPAIG